MDDTKCGECRSRRRIVCMCVCTGVGKVCISSDSVGVSRSLLGADWSRVMDSLCTALFGEIEVG